MLVSAKPGRTVERQASKSGGLGWAQRVLGGPFQLGALLLYGVVICGAYSAVLVSSFAYTDDYLFLYESDRGILSIDEHTMISGGRPLYALLLHLTMPAFSHISDLWALRLLSLTGVTLFAWTLYHVLLRVGMRWHLALVIPLFIVMLPAFQVFAFWGITAFFPFSAVFAGLSATMADTAFQAPGARRALAWASAVLFLFIAIAIYQPTAMVFWLFAAVILFVRECSVREIVLRFASLLVTMGAALVFDFGLSKLVPALLFPHAAAFTRGKLATDVTSKFLFFLQPLLESLNLFHLVNKTDLAPAALLALATGALILTGLPRYFQGDLQTRLKKTALALSLIPLAYLPNLLVAESFGSFRTQVAMESLIAFYVVLAGVGHARQWTIRPRQLAYGFLIAVTLIGVGLVTRDTTTEMIPPQLGEYHAVEAQLRQAPLAQITRIYVYPSVQSDRLSSEVHHDEFGQPTTAIDWYLVPVVSLALDDVAPQEESHITVFFGPLSAPATLGPHDLVLNMHTVLQQARR